MPNHDQRSNASPTWEQQLTLGYTIVDALTSPILPFFRRRLGQRLVSGRMLIATLLFMLLAVALIEDVDSYGDSYEPVTFPYKTLLRPEHPPRPFCLLGFLLLSAFLAGSQAVARRRDMRRGIACHSYSRGESIFEYSWLRNPAVAELLIEPAVTITAGFFVWYGFSTILGGWLILTGLGLRTVEKRIYVKQYKRIMNAVDASIESENFSETIQQFSQHPNSQVYNDGNTEIIHTRLSPDVEALIARRKKRVERKGNERTPKAQLAKPPPTLNDDVALTRSQRFWRFMWGPRLWDWWQKRKTR